MTDEKLRLAKNIRNETKIIKGIVNDYQNHSACIKIKSDYFNHQDGQYYFSEHTCDRETGEKIIELLKELLAKKEKEFADL